jgi:hypothetical protein
MKKFERAKALLSNKNIKVSYEAVLEVALDEFLKDHDPENRQQRREERKGKAASNKKSGTRVEEMAPPPRGARREIQPTCADEHSRHIPVAARDAVFQRDKGRCAYVASNGVRCEAMHRLQIDHIVPYARGGTNAIGNLRLLCERHNKLEAERVYGANAMKRFRAKE